MNRKKLLTSILALMAVAPLGASLSVYNGFDGSSMGLSQSFPASNTAQLSYGSLLTSGGSYERLGGPDDVATLTDPVNATTATNGTYSSDGTVWMSWLYKPSLADDYSRLLIFNSNTEAAGGESYNIGQFGTTMGIYGPFGQVGSDAGIIDVNTTYLMTARLDFGTAAENDASITLWWNPSQASLQQGMEPMGTAQTPVALSNQAESRLELINLNLGGGAGPIFDELRIGETWADVSPVPEPSVYALVFALVSGLVALRRRKK